MYDQKAIRSNHAGRNVSERLIRVVLRRIEIPKWDTRMMPFPITLLHPSQEVLRAFDRRLQVLQIFSPAVRLGEAHD